MEGTFSSFNDLIHLASLVKYSLFNDSKFVKISYLKSVVGNMFICARCTKVDTI